MNSAGAIVVSNIRSGEKVMAAKVAQVFEESLAFIHETSAPKPVILLIVTDGIACKQSILEIVAETYLTNGTN